MNKRWDESELLALIEDQLEPARAEALWAELASDTATLSRMRGMRLDRQLLASVADPVFPAELTSDIDRLATRPLLIETSAAQWRRQHQRSAFRGWALGAAAVIALAAGTGLWVVVRGKPQAGAPGGSGGMVAMGGGAESRGDNVPDSTGGVPQAWPPVDSTIHHRSPLTELADRRVPSEGRRTGSEEGARNAAADLKMIPAPFALVVRVTNREQAVSALRQAARQLGEQTALVKNLTYRDVEQDVEQAVAAAREPDAPARAEASSERSPAPVAPGGLTGTSTPRSHPAARQSPSASILEGPARLGPPLEEQLAFSDAKRGWGAELTLSVPLARLNETLEYLQLMEGQTTTLRASTQVVEGPARGGASAARTSGDVLWAAQVGAVQMELERLRRSDPRAIILVPIVFEQP